MKLRPYQQQLADQVQMQWLADMAVVLMRLDTGGGKTAILAWLIQQHAGFSCLIAHRDKLVEQLSLTLARYGVFHDLIASEKTKRIIARKHVEKMGACYYLPGARCRIASIDTLTRAKNLGSWPAQVTLWIIDEGHHLVKANKWAKGIEQFTHPDCRGLLPTATPKRADGKGLGRHHDGFADVMIEGPPMRWLIDEGYLCDYDVACPPSDMHVEAEPGASGDWSITQLRTAAKASHIVGDVPAHYQRLATGKTGITFSTDIETATETVASYRALGVRAELVTGDTDTLLRDRIFDRLERGELDQVVAVDVISEGVDIPAVQVGSFGRPTQSLAVWMQQVGRILRPNYAPGFDLETREGRLAAIAASNKPRALLIDHTGAFVNPLLGPPDKPRDWSLDRRDKRGKSTADDGPKLRVCTNPAIDCFFPYERFYRACPKCGYEPQPAGRSAPEMVEGDLQLMDPAALAVLQGRALDVTLSRAEHDAAQLAKGAQSTWLGKHWRAYEEKRDAIVALTDSMDRWAGLRHAEGLADYQIQRLFFSTYGCDVLTAQTLDAKDAAVLKLRIDDAVNRA